MKPSYYTVLIYILVTACQIQERQNIVVGEAQGTSYTIKYIGDIKPEIKKEIDSLLLEIDLSMSTYRKDSKIAHLNAGENILLDEMFKRVFIRASEIESETIGVFNPAIGPLISAWGFGFSEAIRMDSSRVDSLLDLCGFNHFKLTGDSLFNNRSGASLNFNAIAQGFAVDLMAELLNTKNIKNYYVELGGELKVRGLNKDHIAWRIGIDKAQDDNVDRSLSHVISLTNTSLATSGNYRKYYEIEGKRYAHTIDPRTGFPVEHNLLSASVVAESCMDADAYATSFMVMGLEKSLEFMKMNEDISAVLTYQNEQGVLSTFTVSYTHLTLPTIYSV